MVWESSAVEVVSDYQFTLPPGVYWAGDPGLMFPNDRAVLAGSTRGPMLAADCGATMPVFRLSSDTVPVFFAINGSHLVDSPTGLVTIVPAVEGEGTPEGCVLFAVFTPTKVRVESGVLFVEGEFFIDSESDPFSQVTFPASTVEPDTYSVHVSGCTLRVYLPPGAYWVGDLRPNFSAALWEKSRRDTSDFHQFAVEIGGEPVIVVPVQEHSGMLIADDGNVFPHGGFLGVMAARRLPPAGGVHTYTLPEGGMLRWRDGVIDVAGVRVAAP